MKNDTFVSQGKYIEYILKKFRMDDAKAISTPMGTNRNLEVMLVAIWWIKRCIDL